MLTLSILTPNKKVLSEIAVAEVSVPGFRGELNLLPGHAHLVTTLTTGLLRYRTSEASEWQSVAVSWGYCEAGPERVMVLAETAETPDELDAERIRIALTTSNERLAAADLEPEDILKFQRKQQRAQIRQELLRMGENVPGGDHL